MKNKKDIVAIGMSNHGLIVEQEPRIPEVELKARRNAVDASMDRIRAEIEERNRPIKKHRILSLFRKR